MSETPRGLQPSRGEAPLLSRAERASEANRSTAACWSHFESHRANITHLIRAAVESRPAPPARANMAVCVLGAGNGNDLDLLALDRYFSRVDLIDIDGEALERCLARVAPDSTAAVEAHRLDLMSQSDLDAFIRKLHGTFDVVVSSCTLSQLVEHSICETGTDRLPVDQIAHLRRMHFRLMLDLCAVSGTSLVINDLVSSMTVPSLGSTEPSSLPALMEHVVSNGNFFTGCNPFAILGQVGADPQLAPMVELPMLHRPWIWKMTDSTERLTYAISFRRK